jgi:hypothetical protein
MISIIRFSFVVAAVAGLGLTAASPARAECTTLGAIGTGLTEDIAKFMAEAGLKNIRENKGMSAQSAVKFKCDTTLIVTECSARQRACK